MEHIQKIAVQAVDINAWYEEKQVLYNITLAIHSSEVTALIGPFGCGKSTFLRCINRMHEGAFGARITGSLRIGGEEIYAPSIHPRSVQRRVSMISQQPPFVWAKNIWEHVAIGVRMSGISPGKALDDLIEGCFSQASLWEEIKDRRFAPASDLSRGQQQRLCIARALAIKPEIILMYDPTSTLDSESTSKVEAVVRELKREYTVVIVTHDMQQVKRIADKTILFHQGRVIEVGETKELFSNPQQEETKDYLKCRFSPGESR